MMSDDLLTTLIQGYDRYQTLAARDWSSLRALAVQTVDDFWSVLLAANDGHLVPLEASPHGTKLYHWRAGWRQTYTSTASASSMISAWISEDLSLTVSIAGESIFMERWDHATQTYPHLAVVAENGITSWNCSARRSLSRPHHVSRLRRTLCRLLPSPYRVFSYGRMSAPPSCSPSSLFSRV